MSITKEMVSLYILKLQAQENYKKTNSHGEQVTIHNTGKIKSLINYENGVKSGVYTKYYKTGKASRIWSTYK